MRWTVHGERSLYESAWVSLGLVDVEVPGGPRFDHHVVRMPQPAAGVVVVDPGRGVLLLWRHRFITDTWGWEVPAGRVDEGESAEEGARRETLEETGWRPGPLRPLVSFRPFLGTCDQTFHIFLADGAERVGDPVDASEAERVEWVPVEQVRSEIQAGRIVDGLTLVGLLHGLAFGSVG
jgi:8-oxo-dGTP pyrophosphatase MutT (NUDIX family)